MALVCSAASVAHAHEDIDQAREAYANADLEGALEALDRAEESGVDPSELTQLVTMRVLVHVALGNDDEVTQNLRNLASFAPGTELPAEIPPAVRTQFQALVENAAPIAMETEVASEGDQVRVRGTVQNDSESLTDTIVVGARVPGGEWEEGEGEVVIRPGDVATVETYAEAFGPGGALLAADGSADDPIERTLQRETSDAEGGGLSTGAVVGIAAGAAAVALIVVIGIVVAGGDSGDPLQPRAPMVQF
ncbi:MAG: hypothetical protein AAGE52_09195 [Myxococcota bacterium]